MASFLHRSFDYLSPEIANAFDELPFWSAATGQLLLENLPYSIGGDILDIGCGAGFPLLVMARRFGPHRRLIGIDTWQTALQRAADKIKAWQLPNVELIQCDAAEIPLQPGSIGLITSNLGLNNFSNVGSVLAECRRLLGPNGRLCIATNLRGTFSEFYTLFKEAAVDHPDIVAEIQREEDHRKTLDGLQEVVNMGGFVIERTSEAVTTMTYADGTAFLNDYFTVMAFLPSWKALVPEALWPAIFGRLETLLNAKAMSEGRLQLSIPIAYLELRPHWITPPGSWISRPVEWPKS